MKIKDESELGKVLGRAFSNYANRVENGAIAPFRSFIDGASSVAVNICLSEDGTVNITLIQPVILPLVEPTVLEAPIVESEPVIEEETPKRKRKTE